MWSRCVELKQNKHTRKNSAVLLNSRISFTSLCVCVCVCMVWGGKLESSYPTNSTQSTSSTVLKTYYNLTRMNMKVTQSCLILCDPMDYSPPGFSVHGILQARGLEWVALPSSRGSSPLTGSNPGCLIWQADSLSSEPPGKPIVPVNNTRTPARRISSPALGELNVVKAWLP